jgi:hypothetical protein
MIWQFSTKSQVLVVFKKALPNIIFFEHVDFWSAVNQWRQRASTQRISSSKCF